MTSMLNESNTRLCHRSSLGGRGVASLWRRTTGSADGCFSGVDMVGEKSSREKRWCEGKDVWLEEFDANVQRRQSDGEGECELVMVGR